MQCSWVSQYLLLALTSGNGQAQLGDQRALASPQGCHLQLSNTDISRYAAFFEHQGKGADPLMSVWTVLGGVDGIPL